MTTTTIAVDTEGEQVTLVNVFTVAPGHQDELVDALDRATVEVFVGDPGFVSANLHASLDGSRVINYAQWTSRESYEAALARPEVREHIGKAAALAVSYDPTLVRVRAVHHVGAGEPFTEQGR